MPVTQQLEPDGACELCGKDFTPAVKFALGTRPSWLKNLCEECTNGEIKKFFPPGKSHEAGHD